MNVTLLKNVKPTDKDVIFLVDKLTYKYTQRGVLYRVFGLNTKEESDVEVEFDVFTKNTQMRIWEAIETHKARVQEVNDLLEAVRRNGPHGLGFDLIEVTQNYGARNNGAILLSHPLLQGWNLLNNYNCNFALTKVQKLE